MEPLFTPSPQFAKWATSLEAGISGGNPKGDLWFCGIEYGGGDKQKERAEAGESLEFVDGIPSWGEAFIKKNREECTTWQYTQKVAKVACAFEGQPLTSFRKYILERLCRAHGNTFAMNLYPINFPRSDDHYWTKDLLDWTGFPNKTTYHAWCMQYRFPILRNLVEKYKPKTLICTGTTALNDFKLAFLPRDKLFSKGDSIDLGCKKPCERFLINNGKTSLLITPFFGQGGVMSDEDLKYIANLAKEDF